MRALALTVGLLKDHARTTAVLIELIFGLMFFTFLLQPSLHVKGYTWQEFTQIMGTLSIMTAAISAFTLVWRNADAKITILVLKTGRASYYGGILLASLLLAAFWVTITASLFLTMRSLSGLPMDGAWQLGNVLLVTLGNMLVVVPCFLLFSTLNGQAREPAFAVMLIILGLGSAQIQDYGKPWEQMTVLLPPLLANLKAATAGTTPDLFFRSLTYCVSILALGLIRFYRREF